MAKAHIKTKGGTAITIEGTAEEVAKAVALLGLESTTEPTASREKGRKKATEKAKATPINLVSSLIDGGFFRKPKDLASVKVALEEMGHFYPVTTLSPVLLRLVRRRQLRRLKDQKKWSYTG
jgi:hypothetical protein